VESTSVSDTSQHQPMTDVSGSLGMVSSQPCDSPNRSWNEKKAIGVPKILPGKQLRQEGGHRNSGEIVIGKRWVTGVARDEYFIGGAPRQITLAVCQLTVLERCVDEDLVVPILKRQKLIVGQTESPVFLIVGRAVRNPAGLLGECCNS